MNDAQASEFEPRNQVEERLVALHAGELDPEAFMLELLDAQLFMPVEDDDTGVEGLQRSTQARPLVVEAEEGVQVLVLFTSPERAKPFLAQVAGNYGGGLLAEFSWILDRLGSGVGVAINPGLAAGLDLDPDMVQQIRALAAQRQAGS